MFNNLHDVANIIYLFIGHWNFHVKDFSRPDWNGADYQNKPSDFTSHPQSSTLSILHCFHFILLYCTDLDMHHLCSTDYILFL
jgi:hypothetical protein